MNALVKCCKCKIKRKVSSFTKDSSRTSGMDCICKLCRKEYRVKNKDKELKRWNLYCAKGTQARKRHIVRIATRKKYGSAKNQACFMCNSKAEEWHHFEYKIDSIVPLCHPCHSSIS